MRYNWSGARDIIQHLLQRLERLSAWCERCSTSGSRHLVLVQVSQHSEEEFHLMNKQDMQNAILGWFYQLSTSASCGLFWFHPFEWIYVQHHQHWCQLQVTLLTEFENKFNYWLTLREKSMWEFLYLNEFCLGWDKFDQNLLIHLNAQIWGTNPQLCSLLMPRNFQRRGELFIISCDGPTDPGIEI